MLVTRFDENKDGHKERRKRERTNDEARDRGEDPPQDDVDPEYSHQEKWYYWTQHAIGPLFGAVLYLIMFFDTRKWVSRHEN